MVEIALACAIVRQPGTFDVTIDDGKKVSALKEAIKSRSDGVITVPWPRLQLFLAKAADGAWLKNEDPCVSELEEGSIHPDVQTLIDGDKMTSNRTIKEVLDENKLPTPRSKQVHVLVVVPDRDERSSRPGLSAAEDSEVVTLKEYAEADERDETRTDTQEIRADLAELELYRRRGQVILEKCAGYCAEILDKIDTLYSSTAGPLPFICVEGSSGMGKSQLAFALKRQRPWFYWLVYSVGSVSQNLYRNFQSVSAQFREFVTRDLNSFGQSVLDLGDLLNTSSLVYQKKNLWTYGFIRALLEYCRSQDAKMIRFDKETKLHVSKCNRKAVAAMCTSLEKDKLPFFILDEMTSNANGGKSIAAFQRNVFRVCGLVVIVMGTDSKISNLVGQSAGSYSENTHMWMSVVPRFPPYQVVHHTTEDKKAWMKLVGRFSVLEAIVKASRGRFARYFVEEVLKCAGDEDITLCTLLDQALGVVCLRTHKGKNFMGDTSGKFAQLMAISYTNAVPSLPLTEAARGAPPLKKRKVDVGVKSMHLHFANLVDTRLTDVFLANKTLVLGNDEQWKPLCAFPGIEEDLLLYLAILGGKSYSGYYDLRRTKTHSTKMIFWEYMESVGFSVNENTQACSNDYKTFENMIAHAIFCASRRNGVQGIRFDAFFRWLLGELRDELAEVELTLDSESIRASDLFDGYPLEMSNVLIPFLAPPNARWPEYILELNAREKHSGCNFGHLVRARNADRCDVYVEGEEKDTVLLLCECKFREKNVGSDVMKGIISELNAVWKGPPGWTFVVVFCVNMADIQTWEEAKIGCVKINSQSGCVEWKFQPEERNREKLVIVVETGGIHPAFSAT